MWIKDNSRYSVKFSCAKEYWQYYPNISNIGNTYIDWFVLNKILLVPALILVRKIVHEPSLTST